MNKNDTVYVIGEVLRENGWNGCLGKEYAIHVMTWGELLYNYGGELPPEVREATYKHKSHAINRIEEIASERAGEEAYHELVSQEVELLDR